MLWNLIIALGHASSLENLFSCIFPDSAITDEFSLGKEKTKYFIIGGVFAAFRQKLKSIINDSPWFLLSYDESLNRNQQKCQMDVN